MQLRGLSVSDISKLSPFELRDYLRHAARTRGVWSAAREAYLDGVPFSLACWAILGKFR